MENAMKNAIIYIKGYQNEADADEDVTELMTDGEYFRCGDVSTFSYMESELTGFEGTKTTFDVENDRVVMTREGAVSNRLIFQEGKKHHFVYETPYGSVIMGVDTHGINQHMDDSGGDLEINYVIDMDNSVLSRNRFIINVREA